MVQFNFLPGRVGSGVMFKCFTAHVFHASVANDRDKGLMLMQRFTMLPKKEEKKLERGTREMG